MLNFGFKRRNNTLPRANLVASIPNRYPFTDRIGKHDGPAQLRQFAEVASGTVTLYHPAITGSEAITSHGGTASVSVIAGAIVIGAGTCWEIRDSAGHYWSHCASLTATSVVMWDVSGKGDHLVVTGLDAAVVDVLCSSGREFGSNYLDVMGWTAANGTQYMDNAGQYLLPDGTIIPSLETVSVAASWSWLWEQILEDGDEVYVDGELTFEGI